MLKKSSLLTLIFLQLFACEQKNLVDSKTEAATDTLQIIAPAKKDTPVTTITTTDTSLKTEEKLLEEELKKRHLEDEQSYTELNQYDGTYLLDTESEGVTAIMNLKYKGDRTFYFKWNFNVDGICQASKTGLIAMDRTQHGFFAQDSCYMHFNFMGFWNGSYVLELDGVTPACKFVKGDCIFNGNYLKKEK